ncbi:hypothetical protein [Lysobacter solisilvae (ex Woo and Kim 2020)]|uniref:Uncharacterized protein n=1 Tax=Agrilutibacter terrestris TaxID=2865112 RepID=A0A7H0FUE6_9GAMM|nr:hypothetical protein [Lysobacter terrestris]QNP39662.1 hypothetical protein H8B22_09000 [Lysobacter terrestris]
MNARKYAGYTCVALGFALIVLLGYGVIDPIGGLPAHAASMRDVLIGLMPSVLLAVGAFAIGLLLLRGPKK